MTLTSSWQEVFQREICFVCSDVFRYKHWLFGNNVFFKDQFCVNYSKDKKHQGLIKNLDSYCRMWLWKVEILESDAMWYLLHFLRFVTRLRNNFGQWFYLSSLATFLEPAVGNDTKWLLCYRASTHGWGASDFHSRCDGKYHTVAIIKVGDYVFGGYTDIPWGNVCILILPF